MRGKIAKLLRKTAEYDMRIERRMGSRKYQIQKGDAGREIPCLFTSGARFDYLRMKGQYKSMKRSLGHRIFRMRLRGK